MDFNIKLRKQKCCSLMHNGLLKTRVGQVRKHINHSSLYLIIVIHQELGMHPFIQGSVPCGTHCIFLKTQKIQAEI